MCASWSQKVERPIRPIRPDGPRMIRSGIICKPVEDTGSTKCSSSASRSSEAVISPLPSERTRRSTDLDRGSENSFQTTDSGDLLPRGVPRRRNACPPKKKGARVALLRTCCLVCFLSSQNKTYPESNTRSSHGPDTGHMDLT